MPMKRTLDGIARELSDAGIEDPMTEALLLAARFTGFSEARLLADRGIRAEYESDALEKALAERKGRRPLQYILGEWEFCGLPIRVTEDCLVPRPDTEPIAERAAALLPPGGRFLDLCTGSGCLAAAVCHLARNKILPGRGWAVELFPKTADLARGNLEALGFGPFCAVLTGDLRDPGLPLPPEPFDLITANPPYIAADEMDGLAPEVRREPRAALTDESDGLSLIRAILSLYRSRLAESGVMLIEHGWKQGEEVRKMAEDLGYDYAPVFDREGRTRGAEIRIRLVGS